MDKDELQSLWLLYQMKVNVECYDRGEMRVNDRGESYHPKVFKERLNYELSRVRIVQFGAFASPEMADSTASFPGEFSSFIINQSFVI